MADYPGLITPVGHLEPAADPVLVIRRLKACLNGGRTRDEHPAVPLTPVELAAAAAGAVAAGAEALHLHPRGPDGVESLRAGDIGAAVAAVRAACPGTPVGDPPDCGSPAATREAGTTRWPAGAGSPRGSGRTSPRPT